MYIHIEPNPREEESKKIHLDTRELFCGEWGMACDQISTISLAFVQFWSSEFSKNIFRFVNTDFAAWLHANA